MLTADGPRIRDPEPDRVTTAGVEPPQHAHLAYVARYPAEREAARLASEAPKQRTLAVVESMSDLDTVQSVAGLPQTWSVPVVRSDFSDDGIWQQRVQEIGTQTE
jgi:hypothetical protein